jgi:phosphoribosylamine--glycine ligase
MKKILVIGSGGREYIICKQLLKSQSKIELFAIPGNAGIAEIAVVVDDIDINKNSEIVNFCKINKIDLVIIGPEQPLVNGLVDELLNNNIKAFGPNKNASKLEGSKIFMKELVSKNSIPTAHYQLFDDEKLAVEYLKTVDFPIVIKTDGLASGKGVFIAKNFTEASNNVKELFLGKFGDAGKRIIIEEFLDGFEVSYFVICDGKNFIPLGFAHDHKRVGDNDTGPNTGGMGSYSPSPFVDKNLEEKIIRKIIRPTLKGLENINHSFVGILFAGLMIVKNEPKLLEFNIRFGDPEAQVIIPKIKTPLLEIINAAIDQNLDKIKIEFDEQSKFVCVVLSANGYPEKYQKGSIIEISDNINNQQDISIIHCGTSRDKSGNLIANGGRVLNVLVNARNFHDARVKAYQAIKQINWKDCYYRSDIAKKAENF